MLGSQNGPLNPLVHVVFQYSSQESIICRYLTSGEILYAVLFQKGDLLFVNLLIKDMEAACWNLTGSNLSSPEISIVKKQSTGEKIIIWTSHDKVQVHVVSLRERLFTRTGAPSTFTLEHSCSCPPHTIPCIDALFNKLFFEP